MRKPTLKKTLNETLAENRRAEQGWANMFGKPLRKDAPMPNEKVVRAKSAPSAGAKEADVLKAVMGFLKLHPRVGWVRRMNVGATETQDGRYIKFGFTGCSDIIGQMKDGRFLAIEVKREVGGKASEAQLAFIYTIQRHGGVAGVAHSVDDVVRILEEAK